jgi:type IV pilus assembly protein PilB
MVGFGGKTPSGRHLKIAGEPNLVKMFSMVVSQHTGGDLNELASKLAALILGYAVREGASDIHFDIAQDHTNLRFRIDGQLRDMLTYPRKEFPITSRVRVMSDFSPQPSAAYKAEDGRFQVNVDGHMVQFRVSSFPTIFGDKLVLRILDMGANTLNINALGFSIETLAKVKAISYAPSGLFIVSGLTGCGKTTTLCSILNMRRNEEINIMTLEDPVEYVLGRVTHSQVNAETGFTFAHGLRSILRQDPNIVMVGEIRDPETANIALRAAMTGHLIFSTVHASSTIGAIHRLLSMDIEPYMIASSLTGVLSQRLVRKVCTHCAQRVEPDFNFVKALVRTKDSAYLQRVTAILEKPGAKFYKAAGCEKCSNTGYKGRTGIFELLIPNDVFRNYIVAKGRMDISELRVLAMKTGGPTLLMDALDKFTKGITTQEEVIRVAGEIF